MVVERNPEALVSAIKVLLADDHPIVREGLRSYLSTQRTLNVVGEAVDGMDVLDKASSLSPDVVLMDIAMPRLNGIETTRHLSSSKGSAKVLILSIHEEREYILESYRAGARGYILKDSAPSDVTRAIEAVYAGDPFYTVGTARLLLESVKGEIGRGSELPAEELTPREREILSMACEGLRSAEIARRLSVSIRTIDAHRRNIKRKLGIHSMAGLTRYALKNGLIKLP
ncbi:MAG TPA: response regulator transcription factor [Planctomycetota bacterium]|nr:response regulator transcription factor [Planctomycetota bacterium]